MKTLNHVPDNRRRVLIVFALCGCALSAGAGETLDNGIVLPDVWPPKIKTLTRAPLAQPPYLKQPPKVIPIDVGRQLFVDDFLIESTTLKRTHHQAQYHAASPVLVPDRPSAGPVRRPRAGVFSDGVWFDPQDQLFKAWYHGGTISENPLHYATCYATSKDGIRWEKPRLNVVPGTNIVLPDEGGLRRNSSTVWLDHGDPDRARRFKMFHVVQQDYTSESGRKAHRNFIQHHISADGIHWKLVGQSVDCGDRTTVFFNAHRRRWVAGLREGSPLVSRCRGYYEAADALGMLQFGNPQTRNHELCLWIGADELDPAREDLELRRIAERPWDLVPSQLYNLDCNAYESILIGLFSIWRGHPADEVKRPKINEVCIGFSRDGFHWTRPDRRAFYGVSEDPQAWNYGNVQSAGGCCLVVGDQLYFYAGGTKWGGGSFDPNHTGLAVLRRDGFTSMDAGEAEGSLTTRPLRFSGRYLFVNVAAPRGALRAEVLDEQGQPIAPFTADNCEPVRADRTKTEMKWKGAADLSAVSGRPVRFRFHLQNGGLYAFWVSPDASGASHGYVAAGGPGFTDAKDTTGE
jgi:hypothetical protein